LADINPVEPMDNSELDQLLKAARIPHPPAEFCRDFPSLIVQSLRNPRQEDTVAYGGSMWRPVVLGTALVVCLAIGFIAGHRRGKDAPNDLLTDTKVTREILTLFPNQVRAIVADASGWRLLISNEPNVSGSAPVWVMICEQSRCTELLTFSGQELEVEGLKMTVLTDAADGVIIAGEHFAWTSTRPDDTPAEMIIHARVLQFEHDDSRNL